MTTQSHIKPWITRDLKQLIRRKPRTYETYSATRKTSDWEIFTKLKKLVHLGCKGRYTEYLNGIIMSEDHKPKSSAV